jgi:parallel beta-helix repeat protein
VVSGTAKYVRQDHRVSLGLLMFAFALAGMMVLGGGRALASHVDCGETITADTTLDSDLINCPAHGIVIGADNITLDLNGHTVDGDGGEDDFGDFGIDNMDGHDGVTIEGGSIRQFGEGIEMDGARDNIVRDLATSHQLHAGVFVFGSSDVRIESNSAFSHAAGIVLAQVSHVRVEHNSVSGSEFGGIPIFESDHVVVAGNTVSGGGASGIVFFDSHHNWIERNRSIGNEVGLDLESSDHNRFERNTAAHNKFAGVVVERSDDNLVQKNSLVANGDGAIIFESNRTAITGNRIVGCPNCGGSGISLELGEGSLIARNHIRRTVGDGIRIGAFDPGSATSGTVVRDNRVHHVGGDGVAVAIKGEEGAVIDTLLERNIAIHSGDDGLDIQSPGTTLTRNVTNRNHDLGIEAIPGVTDAGGNKAHANGDPRQCTHISCG